MNQTSHHERFFSSRKGVSNVERKVQKGKMELPREERDRLALERSRVERDPVTGFCIEPEKLAELSKKIGDLTHKIEVPSL